ncbi:type II toxin-antitoxin system RelE/ParE family toxin [Aequorivita capsosiphonis]|uniref:type II toxin-antitoxin system RelE/ParE family toxin n=1 Tax=Aequorivita capsosiphonis TaxID=487317 RepID=UPI000428A753|nr:type II toxin-antitoxin system RelE/ParE family toxin [Aequorivita capsosiphonis]
MKQNFDIQLLPEAVEFLNNLDSKARNKIYYNLKKVQYTNNKELFKKLNEFIWEFRTLYNGKIYRLFSFWDKTGDEKTIVIGTHLILKKAQKTPPKEIKKAESIRSKYFENKTKM